MGLERLSKQGEYVASRLELCHSRGQRRGFFPRERELSGNFQLAGRATQQRQVCFESIEILPNLTLTAVWTRIEMSRDFFVKASLTFFDQIILPIRNQMVGKV